MKLGWEERFEHLKAYRRKHGNCNVPCRYAANPSLGRWVDNQRQSHKKGEIPDDRVERLEGLGFKWVVKRCPQSAITREEYEDEDLMERDDRGNGIKIKNRDHDEERHPAVAIGEVGYIFWKQFDVGWYKGEVIEIRPGAAKGKDRRCRYTDGDKEDLSVPELRTLAKLLDRKLKKIRDPQSQIFTTPGPRSQKEDVSERLQPPDNIYAQRFVSNLCMIGDDDP